MDETLQNTIAELLNKFGITFDETKIFSTDTLIPYIKELIGRVKIYKIVTNGIALFVFIILMALAITFFVKLYKNYKLYDKTGEKNLFFDCYDTTTFSFAGIIISLIIVLLSLAIIPACISEIIEWIFIPDIQFIEYISELISA